MDARHRDLFLIREHPFLADKPYRNARKVQLSPAQADMVFKLLRGCVAELGGGFDSHRQEHIAKGVTAGRAVLDKLVDEHELRGPGWGLNATEVSRTKASLRTEGISCQQLAKWILNTEKLVLKRKEDILRQAA